MTGRHLTIAAMLAFGFAGVAEAGESQQQRRQSLCAKLDQPQMRANLTPQQRHILRRCKAQRSVPWVIDPTPTFIL